MRILAVLIFLFTVELHARVFNIHEASVATYFKGNIGTSYIKKDAYDQTSGTSTVFTDESEYNFGGELGFIFPSKFYAFRLGLSIISPSSPSGIKGNDIADPTSQLMSVDSKVYGFFPVAHFEYYPMSNAYGRVYLSLGGGVGKISMKNEYHLTTAGDTAYTTPNEFSISASQYTYLVEGALGYELSFVQSTTVSFDFGYRYAVARKLEYESNGPDFGGGHASGDPVVNANGKHKSLDLGGVFTGLSFRFYFQ